jgi:hypothetical protein
MELTLYRYDLRPDYSQGLLFVNGTFVCDTLEDGVRDIKIPNKTAIPYGRYKVELRNLGGLNTKYKNKFSELHKGMIWLKKVPNFTFIYIHIGNTINDSAGCILVGDKSSAGKLGNSTSTYKQIYPMISDAIEQEDVYITVIKDLHLMPALFLPGW